MTWSGSDEGIAIFSVDAIHLILFEFRNYKFGPCLHIVILKHETLMCTNMAEINSVTSRENDLLGW